MLAAIVRRIMAGYRARLAAEDIARDPTGGDAGRDGGDEDDPAA